MLLFSADRKFIKGAILDLLSHCSCPTWQNRHPCESKPTWCSFTCFIDQMKFLFKLMFNKRHHIVEKTRLTDRWNVLIFRVFIIYVYCCFPLVLQVAVDTTLSLGSSDNDDIFISMWTFRELPDSSQGPKWQKCIEFWKDQVLWSFYSCVFSLCLGLIHTNILNKWTEKIRISQNINMMTEPSHLTAILPVCDMENGQVIQNRDWAPQSLTWILNISMSLSQCSPDSTCHEKAWLLLLQLSFSQLYIKGISVQLCILGVRSLSLKITMGFLWRDAQNGVCDTEILSVKEITKNT